VQFCGGGRCWSLPVPLLIGDVAPEQICARLIQHLVWTLFIYYFSLRAFIPWEYVARTKEKKKGTGQRPLVADHNKEDPPPSAVRWAQDSGYVSPLKNSLIKGKKQKGER
jgi:hypothetical protein